MSLVLVVLGATAAARTDRVEQAAHQSVADMLPLAVGRLAVKATGRDSQVVRVVVAVVDRVALPIPAGLGLQRKATLPVRAAPTRRSVVVVAVALRARERKEAGHPPVMVALA